MTTERLIGNKTSVRDLSMREIAEKAEYDHIIQVLKSVNWKVGKAAEVLKINRSTLFRKMVKYGIEKGVI